MEVKMLIESYLEKNRLAPGTILEFSDIAKAIADDSGYVIQIKRGEEDEEQSYQVFIVAQDWIDTLMYTLPIGACTPVNLWSSKEIIDPRLPIFVPRDASPFKIVSDILRKNHITFKCTIQNSKNMNLAKAKIELLELEYSSYWIDIRMKHEPEWLKAYNDRKNAVDENITEVSQITMEEADKRPYKISKTKYPRVYVKTETVRMVPIYHTDEESSAIIVENNVGKTWNSVGLNNEPEFWVAYNGQFIKQPICYYNPKEYISNE
jgi:hypothetical protein